MLATLKVTGVNKTQDLPSNSVLIDVSFDIVLEGQVLSSGTLQFPSTHTKDQIQTELKVLLDTFNKQREAELAAQAAQAEEVAAVDQVVSDLTGFEVTPDDGLPSEDVTESAETDTQTETVVQDDTSTEVQSETTEPQAQAEASAQEAQPANPEAAPTQ